MEKGYLDKLEKEFRRHDLRRSDFGPGQRDRMIAEAVQRGRQYQALAIRLAVVHIFAGVRRFLHRPPRPKTPPRVSSKAQGKSPV